jgi:hypothetical protein
MDTRDEQLIHIANPPGKRCVKLVGKVKHADRYGCQFRFFLTDNCAANERFRAVARYQYVARRARPVCKLYHNLSINNCGVDELLPIPHVQPLAKQIPHLLPAHATRLLGRHGYYELACFAIVDWEPGHVGRVGRGVGIGF